MFKRLAFLLQVFIFLTTLRAQRPVRFSATIKAGDSYVHPIGHGLFFALQQDDGGTWNFQIRPSPEVLDSYADCLKSPFMHGPDVDDLLSWRFAPGAAAETLPVTDEFTFTTNAADQNYECANQTAMVKSFQASQREGRDPNYKGLKNYKPRPKGHATVVISSVSLKPDLKNPEFEKVSLSVTVNFPTARRNK